jgi:hypothetical protein
VSEYSDDASSIGLSETKIIPVAFTVDSDLQ